MMVHAHETDARTLETNMCTQIQYDDLFTKFGFQGELVDKMSVCTEVHIVCIKNIFFFHCVPNFNLTTCLDVLPW